MHNLEHNPFVLIPPVAMVPIECDTDRVIARDTARRIAGTLGFAPIRQAQISSAAAELVELILRTGKRHELEFNGVQDGDQVGLQVRCSVPWLRDAPEARTAASLQKKLGELTDMITFESGDIPQITMLVWQAG